MKINQSAVSPQPKLPVRENTEKAGAASGQSEDDDDTGVMLSVSQRNAVNMADGLPEKPAGGIKMLLGKLLGNPENTAAHTGISPEKVLQLLA